MIGTRAALVVAAFASLSVTMATPPNSSLYKRAANRPYAPDLYSRAELQVEEDSTMGKRDISSKRPYAPDLFSRSSLTDEDESDFALRRQVPHGQMFYTSGFNGVLGCTMECPDSHFCSFASGQCEEKLALESACNEDSACSSGYCGGKGKCTAKSALGLKCLSGVHQSCASDYCSVTSHTCKKKQNVGGACLVSAGCQDGLSCINKQCHEYGAAVTPQKRRKEEMQPDATKRGDEDAPTKTRKRDDSKEVGQGQELTKRWFYWPPSPSGYKRAITMKSVETDQETTVEKRSTEEDTPTKRSHWKNPSPSGYYNPVPLYPYQKPPKNNWWWNNNDPYGGY